MTNSQGGPPDIEEMLRNFAARFGGKQRNKNLSMFSRDGGGDSEDPPKKRGGLPELPAGKLTLLVSSVLLVLFAISGFYTVDESERALNFRLGKPIGISSPGLRWRIPFVDDYYIVNLSGVRTVEIGYRNNSRSKILQESLMLTDNLNIIDLQFAVQYLLKDPEAYLYNNRDPEGAVLQVAETAMREIVGSSDIDFVLYEGREQIATDTLVLMQEILDRYQTGILVQQVAIQNVQPPDQVQDAFEDAIRARQDRERKINEGQAYANDIVPKAYGQSARIVEDSEAYRAAIIAKSEGESRRFKQIAKEFELAPEVTRQRLYIDTLEEVMAKTGKILIDQKGANSIFYLPLDKIIGQRRTPSAADSDLAGGVPELDAYTVPAGARQDLEQARSQLRRQNENAAK